METSKAISNDGTTNNPGEGIKLNAFSYGTGSVATQNATITGANVSGFYGNNAVGIDLTANARYGGTTSQTASLSTVTINNKASSGYSSGIVISAEAFGSGAMATQSATVSGANVSYVNTSAFAVEAYAASAAHVVQTATITNSSGTHSYTGLQASAEAVDNNNPTPTTVDQTLSVTGSNFANE